MSGDVEALLRQALAPIEPPAELEARLEATLGSIVEMAADELDSWELSAMRDPRNWPRQAVRPAAAIVVGSAAAVGLVAVRTQRKRHGRRAESRSALELAERTLHDLAAEARRVAHERSPRK
jgi:hypothetical protein